MSVTSGSKWNVDGAGVRAMAATCALAAMLPVFNSTALAAARPVDSAPSLPLSGDALWEAVVKVFSGPEGRVDLETLKSSLRYDPATNDPKDGKIGVYWGATGADNKLGFLFNSWPGRQPPWHVDIYWLDDAHPLKSGGRAMPAFCFSPEKIETDLIAAGWKEKFAYSRYKSLNTGGSGAVEQGLPASATFNKGSVELTVTLTPAGRCFYYLMASPVPYAEYFEKLKKNANHNNGR